MRLLTTDPIDATAIRTDSQNLSNWMIVILLVLNAFFVSYAVGLNSRHVIVSIEKSPIRKPEPIAGKGRAGLPRLSTVKVIEPVRRAPVSAVFPVPRTVTLSPQSVDGGASGNMPAAHFRDVGTAQGRLQPALKKAADTGILDQTADEQFHPNEPVSRADFTRWMVRIRQVPLVPTAGHPAQEPGSPAQNPAQNPGERASRPLLSSQKAATPCYNDVQPQSPYFAEIEAATRENLVKGYTPGGRPNKLFKPMQDITRQEFAVMYCTFSGKRGRAELLKRDQLNRYLQYDPTLSRSGELSFKDVGDIDDWGMKWVAVANQAGVLDQAFQTSPAAQTEANRYFHPQRKMTRAEAVNILVRLYGAESRSAVH